jgi:hypothetical protein
VRRRRHQRDMRSGHETCPIGQDYFSSNRNPGSRAAITFVTPIFVAHLEMVIASRKCPSDPWPRRIYAHSPRTCDPATSHEYSVIGLIVILTFVWLTKSLRKQAT